MTEAAHWQVQEAKQRFSEVLRAVEREGPQIITRHGEEVAVVISIEEYRKPSEPPNSFAHHLLSFPKLDTSTVGDVFAEIEDERKRDFPREIDLGTD
ncbi:MAG: type II toxin-antitoxin system Phd/YefM family antitoxin [Micromonosporaceae bacterium]